MGTSDLSCGMKCLKYLLFIYNFIIWLCGLAVMGVGIYSRVKAGDWGDLVDNASVADAANILIAAGAIVTVIGFLGCCGAWKQNRFLLVLFIIMLLLIFILEIAAGIYAYTKKDDVIKSLEKGFTKAITTSYGIKLTTNTANKGLSTSVDWFQQNVKCCGASGPKDWKTSAWYNDTKHVKAEVVPKSCCKVEKDGCNHVAILPLIVYQDGCVTSGDKFIKDHMWQVGGVGVGIAFVQLVGIIFSILLVRAIAAEQM